MKNAFFFTLFLVSIGLSFVTPVLCLSLLAMATDPIETAILWFLFASSCAGIWVAWLCIDLPLDILFRSKK
jgi:hypothetical protein